MLKSTEDNICGADSADDSISVYVSDTESEETESPRESCTYSDTRHCLNLHKANFRIATAYLEKDRRSAKPVPHNLSGNSPICTSCGAGNIVDGKCTSSICDQA